MNKDTLYAKIKDASKSAEISKEYTEEIFDEIIDDVKWYFDETKATDWEILDIQYFRSSNRLEAYGSNFNSKGEFSPQLSQQVTVLCVETRYNSDEGKECDLPFKYRLKPEQSSYSLEKFYCRK